MGDREIGTNTPASFLEELYRRNRLLAVIGWLHVGLFAAAFVAALFDRTEVMGINAWIKPMKFMLSLAIYLWTIAWFSDYIRKPRIAVSLVSVVIACVIIVESACILVQAARGTTSHFNTATDFDASVFSTMGLMIGIDMLMTIVILALFFKPSKTLHPVYLWSIRLGIVTFLAGGTIGGMMIGNNAHTVGAPDGGPGLPILNWSTEAGDLRIAHGLALHGLQIIPLAGHAISRWDRFPGALAKSGLFALALAGYLLIVYGTWQQAMAGRPLI